MTNELEIPQNSRLSVVRVDKQHVVELTNCGPSEEVFVVLPNNVEIGPVRVDKAIDFEVNGEVQVRNRAGAAAKVSCKILGPGGKTHIGAPALVPSRAGLAVRNHSKRKPGTPSSMERLVFKM